MCGFFNTLFQLAGHKERVMMVVGMLCAVIAGASIPLNALMLGNVINVVTLEGVNDTIYWNTDVFTEVTTLASYEVAVATVSFLCSYGAVVLWSWSAARLGAKVRQQFFQSLMTQSIGWFEANNISEIVDRFETDIPKLDKGLGEEVPMCLQWFVTWLSSYVVAFKQSWKLSLTVLFFTPIVFIVNRAVMKKVSKMALEDYQIRVTAGMEAKDVLSRVTTVHTYQSLHQECQRYHRFLRHTLKEAWERAVVFGAGEAFPWVVHAYTFVVIFGYGNYLVLHEQLRPGNIFPVFVGVLFALAGVQQVVYHLDNITGAMNSLPPVLEVLECSSPINVFTDKGLKPREGLQGSIDFRGVFFRYPRNICRKVLDSFDMRVKAGESVAVFGSAVYSLSAIPKLIFRMYDVNRGQVVINGQDIREYNVRWLRQHISYVTKDMVVLPISIADNICLGHEDVTQEQLEAVIEDVDLNGLVSGLATGYDTVVSEETETIKGLGKLRGSVMQKREVMKEKKKSIVVPPLTPAVKKSASSKGEATATGETSSISSSSESSSSTMDTTSHLSITGSVASVFSIATTFVSPIDVHRRGTILWTNLDQANLPKSKRLTSRAAALARAEWSTSESSSDLHINPLSGRPSHNAWKSETDATVKLTYGQRMQVVMARALVNRPAILVMEDVLALINPASLHKMLTTLSARKQTVVVVTNSMTSASLLNKVVVIAKGRKVAEGTWTMLASYNSASLQRYMRNVGCVELAAEKRKMLAIFQVWKRKSKRSKADVFRKVVEMACKMQKNERQTHTRVFITAMAQISEKYSAEHSVKTPSLFVRMVHLLGSDLLILSVGLLIAVLLGLTHTSLAYCVGHTIVAWYEMYTDSEGRAKEHDIFKVKIPTKNLVYIIFASVPVVIVLRMMEHASFTLVNIQLTEHVRALMFKALLRQEVQYFDITEHSPVLMGHSLTHDPGLLQTMVGVRMGAVMESCSILVAGFTMAVVSEWRTALILFSFGPLSLLGSLLQGEIQIRGENNRQRFKEQAEEVFLEAVENISTIAALNLKPPYKQNLDSIVDEGKRYAERYAHLYGLGYAAVNIIMFLCTGLFIYTARYVSKDKDDDVFPQMFMAFIYLVLGLAGLDYSLPKSCLVSYSRAKMAACRIFSLIDSPAMVKPHEGGTTLQPFKCQVSFHLVTFHYPAQPRAQALCDVTLTLQPGTVTALVGPHNCGKSTILKLIEGFYPVHFGSLDVDDTPFGELDVDWWRQQVCLLDDDPALSGDTVLEAITYGIGHRSIITIEAVIKAAHLADIHLFIMSLPRDYNTGFERDGTNIFSKEQRIRLAMARAVLRHPRLLLVDNITKSIQPHTGQLLKTLKHVTANRTCVIATNHILEIIEADLIVVLSHGRIIERGTHRQLMARRGCYFVMLHRQERERRNLIAKLLRESKKFRRSRSKRKPPEAIKRARSDNVLLYSKVLPRVRHPER